METNKIKRLLANQASQTIQCGYFLLLAVVCAAFFYFAIPGEARFHYFIGILPLIATVFFSSL